MASDEILHYRKAWGIMAAALAGDKASDLAENYGIPTWMAEYFAGHAADFWKHNKRASEAEKISAAYARSGLDMRRRNPAKRN